MCPMTHFNLPKKGKFTLRIGEHIFFDAHKFYKCINSQCKLTLFE